MIQHAQFVASLSNHHSVPLCNEAIYKDRLSKIGNKAITSAPAYYGKALLCCASNLRLQARAKHSSTPPLLCRCASAILDYLQSSNIHLQLFKIIQHWQRVAAKLPVWTTVGLTNTMLYWHGLLKPKVPLQDNSRQQSNSATLQGLAKHSVLEYKQNNANNA